MRNLLIFIIVFCSVSFAFSEEQHAAIFHPKDGFIHLKTDGKLTIGNEIFISSDEKCDMNVLIRKGKDDDSKPVCIKGNVRVLQKVKLSEKDYKNVLAAFKISDKKVSVSEDIILIENIDKEEMIRFLYIAVNSEMFNDVMFYRQ